MMKRYEVSEARLKETIQYFIAYYRKMNWQIRGEDLLEMCGETCGEEFNGEGWKICMSARNHLANLRHEPND